MSMLPGPPTWLHGLTLKIKMVRGIGIDPGTVSFDICGWEEGSVFLDESFPSHRVAQEPEVLVELLAAQDGVDVIVGPSGYGLPLTGVQDVGERELFLMTLVEEGQRQGIHVLQGMQVMIGLARERNLPMLFTPGVIHLPTVPSWRKVNRIDLGTADKLNCAVLAGYDQAQTLGLDHRDTSFILVEVGGAYTSVLAVDGGRVVDGLAGTGGPMGFRSPGALDGEVAFLLEQVRKEHLFQGGIIDLVGEQGLTPEGFAERLPGEEALQEVWRAMEEGILKAVAGELALVPGAREILLSGRLCRQSALTERLVARLEQLAPVRQVNSLAQKAKEAAQGAALLAVGLAGGDTGPLVERMAIGEARGTVLDYICPWGDDLKRRYRV